MENPSAQSAVYGATFDQKFEQGAVLLRSGKWPEAETIYRSILSEWPDAPNAHYHLGIVLHYQGHFDQAIAEFETALSLRPEFMEACNGLGNTLIQTHRLAEAAEAYRRVVEVRRDYVPAWNNLAGALKDLGQLDQALVCYDRVIVLRPESANGHSNRLCTLHYHPGYDAPAIFREARRWNDRFALPFRGEIRPHAIEVSPQQRLRIGYISGDFRRHTIALLIAPLLAAHDHQEFEIFCYSASPTSDAVTARLQGYADQWRNISNLSDQEAAEMIRQDKIDILVDLSLHSAGNRLGIFARKPAPQQVTWLGYPGTTGLDAIDYRLTDPQLDPVGTSGTTEIRNSKFEIRINDQNSNDQISNDPQLQGAPKHPESLPHSNIGALEFDSNFEFRISNFSTKEPYYSERSIRLPDTFWCYDPRGMEETEKADLPAPGPMPAVETDQVTFGCLNNFCKATDRTLALWAPILAAVPNSQLILLSPPGAHRARVPGALGVAEKRVQFVELQPRRQYLKTYRRIDLCLDTVPYNGHTTTLDALWMGVPVVTRAGDTVVGRAGWSQLHNLGLDELVAHSDAEFVTIAVNLARNFGRLSDLRKGLRQKMEKSPLMDGPRFTRNVERAYRQIWQAWCANRI